jgi:hypothetical protein
LLARRIAAGVRPGFNPIFTMIRQHDGMDLHALALRLPPLALRGLGGMRAALRPLDWAGLRARLGAAHAVRRALGRLPAPASGSYDPAAGQLRRPTRASAARAMAAVNLEASTIGKATATCSAMFAHRDRPEHT